MFFIVNGMDVKNKYLKLVKCQFLGIVKAPYHDNFGFVAKIMLMLLRFGPFYMFFQTWSKPPLPLVRKILNLANSL